MTVFTSRKYPMMLFVLYVGALVLMLLTVPQLTDRPTASTSLLQNIGFRQDVIINRPYENSITLYEPAHVFLINHRFFTWLEILLSLIGRLSLGNPYVSSMTLIMFYLFFRLSRTGDDQNFLLFSILNYIP